MISLDHKGSAVSATHLCPFMRAIIQMPSASSTQMRLSERCTLFQGSAMGRQQNTLMSLRRHVDPPTIFAASELVLPSYCLSYDFAILATRLRLVATVATHRLI